MLYGVDLIEFILNKPMLIGRTKNRYSFMIISFFSEGKNEKFFLRDRDVRR